MLLPVTEASICTLVLCGRALNSSNVSLQAKANGLLLSPIPPEFSNLNSLELRLHGICKVISYYDLVNSNPYMAQHSSKVKGNVAVYKVLNLEMLLYKVTWHVSTVKDCNLIARYPDAAYAYALTQRDRTRIGDRSCLLRWSEQEKSACMTFIAVRKDEQETADSFYISRLWPGC